MQILICCPTSYEKSYQLFYTNTKICVFTLSVLAFLICLPYPNLARSLNTRKFQVNSKVSYLEYEHHDLFRRFVKSMNSKC